MDNEHEELINKLTDQYQIAILALELSCDDLQKHGTIINNDTFKVIQYKVNGKLKDYYLEKAKTLLKKYNK